MVTVLGVAARAGGTLYSLDLFKEFADRYNFAIWPKLDEIVSHASKLTFKVGRYKQYQINDFEIYNDGIVIKAAIDTDVIDEFINDALCFIDEKWDIRLEKANTIDKMYQSVITFASDKDILSPLNAAKSLFFDVQEGVKNATGFDIPFASAGFFLSVDEATIPSMKPTAFKIERRAGSECQFNHYFSAAPLRTSDHVRTLEKWEASV